VGGSSYHKLTTTLISILNRAKIFTLAQGSKEEGGDNWVSVEDLHLDGSVAMEWRGFITGLNQNAIYLKISPDRLVWTWNSQNGQVEVKEAYAALVSQEVPDEATWWSYLIWKVNAPLKMRCFMWLCLRNKVMTGNNYRRRGGIGPSVCHLCLNDEESVNHLFAECGVTLYIWEGVCSLLKLECSWKSSSVEENLKVWFHLNPRDTSVPFLVVWGIWLHRNKIFFQGHRQVEGMVIMAIFKAIVELRVDK